MHAVCCLCVRSLSVCATPSLTQHLVPQCALSVRLHHTESVGGERRLCRRFRRRARARSIFCGKDNDIFISRVFPPKSVHPSKPHWGFPPPLPFSPGASRISFLISSLLHFISLIPNPASAQSSWQTEQLSRACSRLKRLFYLYPLRQAKKKAFICHLGQLFSV